MCYIALVKNNAEGTATELKRVIADKLNANDDGAFITTLGDSGIRTLDNQLAEQVVLSMPLNNLLVHFRIATTGTVNLDNVQGWTLNGWTCVHNGMITKLSGKNEAKSDSLRFFELLTERLQGERDIKRFKGAIRKLAFKYSFNGRAIVYNPILDIALLFGDWELYEYGGAVVFSSASLWNLGQKVIKESNGIVFEYKEGVPTGEGELDGIYIMDNAKKDNWTIEKIGVLKEPKTEYFSSNHYSSYQGYTYTPITPTTALKPIILPKSEPIKPESKPEPFILQLPLNLPSPAQDNEVVGYDLGGNDIILVDNELHIASGGCCIAGKCAELWDFLDREVADNLIRCGVPYKVTPNPFIHWR